MIEWTIEDAHDAREQGWMIRLEDTPYLLWCFPHPKKKGMGIRRHVKTYVGQLADKGDALAMKAIAYIVQETLRNS